MTRRALATVGVCAGLAALPDAAAAHAFAQRYDLPLPLWLYIVGAGLTVAVSFAFVAWFVDPAQAVRDR